MPTVKLDSNALSPDRQRRNWQRLALGAATGTIIVDPPITNIGGHIGLAIDPNGALSTGPAGLGVAVDGSTVTIVGDKLHATGAGSLSSSTQLSTLAPLVGGGFLSTGLTISIPRATSTANGYLSSTDWTTFNSKQAAGSYVSTSRLINTTAPLTGGGDLTADRTLAIPQATSTANGYLLSTDWTTFNSKLSSVSFATPTALVGLAAIAGSASTAMRSDAAPAFNTAIAPTLTGTLWNFQNSVQVGHAVGDGLRFGSTAFSMLIQLSDAFDTPLIRSLFSNTVFRFCPKGAALSSLEFFGTDFIADASNYSRLLVQAKAGLPHRIYSDTGGSTTSAPISIYASGVEGQLYLTTGGFVGLGTTSPVLSCHNAGGVAHGQSVTAPALATNGTIAVGNIGVSRVAPASAVTGVILTAGTTGGQEVAVVNESSALNTITFAASGTSNVADGVGGVVAGFTARKFIWDSITALWYRVA